MRGVKWKRGLCKLCDHKHRGQDLFCSGCQRELKAQLSLWLEIRRIQREVARVDAQLKRLKGLA